MAKILFISICDKAALGIRYLSGMLKQKGHDTNILFFKEYNQTPKKNIKEQILGEWHEGINQLSVNSFCKKNPEIFKTLFMFRKIFVIAKIVLKL